MDFELLWALALLWIGTTSALITFLSMWFNNEGEAFHPHSVDVDHRHALFLVVNSETVCKLDCAVKNISTYVAPRGSSSSKQFTALCVMISVAGLLGSIRWYAVRDATLLQAAISIVGFASLFLVALFEMDVVPERFLEDKLMITGWLLQKLGAHKKLPFKIHYSNPQFRQFIRNSKNIYHLYDEDHYLKGRSEDVKIWKRYNNFWGFLHMLGAVGYTFCVTLAIILNDYAEAKVAWITGILFTIFCFFGYLTGNYLPVITPFKCWIMTWNPFLKEPYFMLRLQQAVDDYLKENSSVVSEVHQKKLSSGTSRRRTSSNATKEISNGLHDMLKAPTGVLTKKELEAAERADQALDSYFVRYARRYPLRYIKIIGHLMVFVELIAMLTPAIAMGIQWVTALCDDAPVLSILELLRLGYSYLTGTSDTLVTSHFIIRNNKN